MPIERKPTEEAELRASIDQVNRRLQELDARIAANYPDYAELSNPPPVSLDMVFGLLEPEEVLLVYFTDDVGSWVFVIGSTAATFGRIWLDTKALADEVTALRAYLDPGFNPGLRAFPAIRAYELYREILSPAASVLSSAKHVIIVPDGALQSLPFGVLVTKPPDRDPQHPEQHRDIAWFAREHAISVLPSVSSLRALRQHPVASKAAEPFFGVGDPVLRGRGRQERGVRLASLFRGNIADVEKVRELHVRRDKAALFQGVQGPPGDRSSRKQPGQAWR